MSIIYHANRVHEYNIKKQKHEMYVEELNKMIQKRNILFKKLKSLDENDGTVESYIYDPQMEIMRSRLTNMNGNIRSLKKKVERTE